MGTMLKPGLLPLTVSRGQSSSEEQMAGAFGRQLSVSYLPDEGACGDLGPVIGEAVRIALLCVAEDEIVAAIEAEAAPLAPSSLVHLCAQADRNGYSGAAV